MEIILDKARQYILALMEAGSFTYEDVANMSGIPLQTVRNFCTGRTEKNPGFSTIVKIVISLGGDLNELIGYEKKKEIEVNSTVSLKETYEMRISDIVASYDLRIADVKELCEIRIQDIIRCCETRLHDTKQLYESIIAELQNQGVSTGNFNKSDKLVDV